MTPTYFDQRLTKAEDHRQEMRAERARGRREGIWASVMVVSAIGMVAWVVLGPAIAPALLLFVLLSACAAIAAVWSAWVEYDQRGKIAQVPCCPYCPPQKVSRKLEQGVLYDRALAVPATVIMDGRWAWCGQCGAHYRHQDRSWRRPKPGLLGDYRDQARPVQAPPACEE